MTRGRPVWEAESGKGVGYQSGGTGVPIPNHAARPINVVVQRILGEIWKQAVLPRRRRPESGFSNDRTSRRLVPAARW